MGVLRVVWCIRGVWVGECECRGVCVCGWVWVCVCVCLGVCVDVCVSEAGHEELVCL